MNKSSVSSWLSDKSVRWGVITGTSFWLMSLGLLGLNWNSLPPELPWFYSMPWGEQQLIDKSWLMIVVIGFGGILVLDVIIARFFATEEDLLRKILIWGGVMTELLVLLSLLRVVMVVL